jgi:hypothetical protein
MNRQPNNLLESNRRHASALGAEKQFWDVVYAQACAFSGGRSANRSAKSQAIDRSLRPG